jgi:hypothetical protein
MPGSPRRVKLRRSQYEHMFSALPPNSDIARWQLAFRIRANSGHVVGGLIGQDKAGAVRAKGAELAFHFWGLTCAKH